jgi:hypothetical protein
VAGPTLGADPAGDEDGGEFQVPEDAEGTSIRLRIDDLLRQADLFERAPADGPDGGTSRLRLPAALTVPAELLADCWRAVGEGLMPVEEVLGLQEKLPTGPLSGAPGSAVPEGSAPAPGAQGTVGTVPAEPPPQVSLPVADFSPAAVAMPAQPPANPGASVSPATAVAGSIDRGVVEEPAWHVVPAWEQAMLAALAAGGGGLWAEHGSRRRCGVRPGVPRNV